MAARFHTVTFDGVNAFVTCHCFSEKPTRKVENLDFAVEGLINHPNGYKCKDCGDKLTFEITIDVWEKE